MHGLIVERVQAWEIIGAGASVLREIVPIAAVLVEIVVGIGLAEILDVLRVAFLAAAALWRWIVLGDHVGRALLLRLGRQRIGELLVLDVILARAAGELRREVLGILLGDGFHVSSGEFNDGSLNWQQQWL